MRGSLISMPLNANNPTSVQLRAQGYIPLSDAPPEALTANAQVQYNQAGTAYVLYQQEAPKHNTITEVDSKLYPDLHELNPETAKLAESNLSVIEKYTDRVDFVALSRDGFTMTAYDSKGEVLSMTRGVEVNQNTIFINRDSFSIREDLRGGDLIKDLESKFEQTAQEFANSRGTCVVSLDANLEIGAYAWLKYGYVPESTIDGNPSEFADAVAQYYYNNLMDHEVGVNAEDHDEFIAQVRLDLEALFDEHGDWYDVANAPELGQYEVQGKSLFKFALVDTSASWFGRKTFYQQ